MENMLLTRLKEETERYHNMIDFMLGFSCKLKFKEFDLVDVVENKIIRICYWLIDVMELVEDHNRNDIDHVTSVINKLQIRHYQRHDCFLNSAVKTKIKDYIPAFEKESRVLDTKYERWLANAKGILESTRRAS
ncbi:hypothetical protein Tco_1458171 [Tanacetum coccineum]